ncbi:MAG: TIGR04282 family arsenosugar biosynthesis glycosyltransferase [Myxococcales bacterium]|nr:TIGR04282 family arsenosugar biosynthesis glycosyltransferase [Myxococcales bacterium]
MSRPPYLPVYVFARAPVPGETKTRLARVLGDHAAARLYEAFLEDTLATCLSVPEADVSLYCAGDPHHPALRRIADAYRVPRVPQPAGDLGERLRAVFERECGEGDAAGGASDQRVIAIGSDAPTMRAERLIDAGIALLRADLVAGPAADGGFYLLGARGAVPSFEGVRWSTEHTLEDVTRANEGARWETLAPGYDVDTAEGLRLLRVHLATDRAAAPRTREALRAIDSGLEET